MQHSAIFCAATVSESSSRCSDTGTEKNSCSEAKISGEEVVSATNRAKCEAVTKSSPGIGGQGAAKRSGDTRRGRYYVRGAGGPHGGDGGDGEERGDEQRGLRGGAEQIDLQSVDGAGDGELERRGGEPGGEGEQNGAGEDEGGGGLGEEIDVVGGSLGERAREEHEGVGRVEPDAEDLAVIGKNAVQVLVELDLARLHVEDPDGLVFDQNQVGELEEVAKAGRRGPEERRPNGSQHRVIAAEQMGGDEIERLFQSDLERN